MRRQVLAQVSPFSLKRENPAHFKNSDLTLLLKRGSSRSSENLTASTTSEGHFSPRRGNSRSSETILAQARILQYSPGFHSPIDNLIHKMDIYKYGALWKYQEDHNTTVDLNLSDDEGNEDQEATEEHIIARLDSQMDSINERFMAQFQRLEELTRLQFD
ncbi:hypothetical protein Lal_00030250 [Lupinus albus]|nr:hypothetical protein Lal_00030250 [Lupinus albus]